MIFLFPLPNAKVKLLSGIAISIGMATICREMCMKVSVSH